MKQHPLSKILKSNIALSVYSAFLAFMVLEMGAGLWLLRYASDEQLSLYGTFDQIDAVKKFEIRYVRHPYLPYVNKPNYSDPTGVQNHNSLGFRGEEIQVPKPPGIYRIVLLGGSTTYDSSIPDDKKIYSYLLQAMLREKGYTSVEVVNAGVVSYASWESLINLEFKILDLEPDLVIVYHGINDIHPRLVFPFEAYKGDNSGSREAYERPTETIWDYSTVLRIIRTRLGFRKPLGGLGVIRTFQYVSTNFAEEFFLQKINGTYPAGIFSDYSAMEMLEHNKPVYFARNLRNMVAICREHNIKIVLMTFAYSPLFTNEPTVSSPEYINGYTEQNEVIKKICTSHNIPCYDFAAEMPVDEKFWVDGRHNNELGAHLKAELVTNFLDRSGLILLPGFEKE